MASYFKYLDDWIRKDKEAQLEAVKRLGLKPDNTAQDRAKAMGFGDDMYHGTTKDFNSFDPTRKARVVNSHLIDESRNATYVTPDAEEASDFARSLVKNKITFNDGVVMPLKTKGKLFDFNNVDDINILAKELKKNKNLERLDPLYASGFGITKYDSLLTDAKSGNWSDMEKAEIQKIIKSKGYDGYHVKEKDYYPTVASAIYNPANIRSKFAHFNPKMAGVGAGSVLSADLMADELDLEQKPKPSMFKGLMETIGNVNQQQAQAYGNTGVGVASGVGSLLADPAMAAEIAVRGMAGLGLGGLLMSNELNAGEDQQLFLQRLKAR